MIRLARELLRALLEASDHYAAAVQRLGWLRSPPRPAGCPEDGICQHCPAATYGYVCTPQERRAYELVLRYRRNGGSS